MCWSILHPRKLMIARKEANTDVETKLFCKKKLETRLGANIKQAMISLQRMAAERLHRNYYFLFFFQILLDDPSSCMFSLDQFG